jgi:predicted ArsR family transcriptional regulator
MFTFPQNMEVKNKKSRPLHFRIVRDYLYAALGDADRVEIKLSVMGEELGISPKTLYKHLKTLRETEFILTKLQFSTEIRRRQAKNNS